MKEKKSFILILCTLFIIAALIRFSVDNTYTNISYKGDVNEDKQVNIYDYYILKNNVLKKSKKCDYSFRSSDINEDGILNKSDSELMQNYLSTNINSMQKVEGPKEEGVYLYGGWNCDDPYIYINVSTPTIDKKFQNKISSVKIIGNYSVVLFDKENFKGNKYELYYDELNFKDLKSIRMWNLKNTFNDKTMSAKVIKNKNWEFRTEEFAKEIEENKLNIKFTEKKIKDKINIDINFLNNKNIICFQFFVRYDNKNFELTNLKSKNDIYIKESNTKGLIEINNTEINSLIKNQEIATIEFNAKKDFGKQFFYIEKNAWRLKPCFVNNNEKYIEPNFIFCNQ